MKTRHLVFGIVISTLATGTGVAQSTFTNTNTNNNNNLSFTTGSFSMTNGNMRLSQTAPTTNPNSFCQFFSITFGLSRIVQIIQGSSITQTFGSASDPATDPCL